MICSRKKTHQPPATDLKLVQDCILRKNYITESLHIFSTMYWDISQPLWNKGSISLLVLLTHKVPSAAWPLYVGLCSRCIHSWNSPALIWALSKLDISNLWWRHLLDCTLPLLTTKSHCNPHIVGRATL